MGELSFKFLPLTGVLLLALYPLTLELLLLAANTFYLMLAMAELGFLVKKMRDIRKKSVQIYLIFLLIFSFILPVNPFPSF